MSTNPTYDLFNQPKLEIEFNAVHARENNALSQSHLNQHREKFSHDCFKVLQLLVKGERLTVKGAMVSGLTNSLPRRILDLKEFGITISSEWKKSEGSKYLEYFMTDEDKVKALTVLIDKSRMKAA